jgi:hypothetical protein
MVAANWNTAALADNTAVCRDMPRRTYVPGRSKPAGRAISGFGASSTARPRQLPGDRRTQRRRARMDSVDPQTESAISWLLDSSEPAIRLMTCRDLLDGSSTFDADEILGGPKVAALLSGQAADGGFGVGFYRKWTGAHWRLISLTELAVPKNEPRAVAAASSVLARLDPSRRRVTVIGGLPRRCASIEGNALAVCSRLGLAADPRVADLAAALVSWQWPDGGWNCDINASGRRSSFHETLGPAWGLHEYWRATGDAKARDAADTQPSSSSSTACSAACARAR